VSLNVTLFRGFVEDGRQSMEVYGDGLRRAVCSSAPDRCQVREYRPGLWPGMANGPWQMRFARFAAYAWQGRRQQGQVNHIVDHGYGHLLYALDPRRTVVTVHDLIPLVRWCGGIAGVSRGRKPWLNLISFGALRRAKHLIAASWNTQRDLVELIGCDPFAITVIYYGVESKFYPYPADGKAAARHALQLPSDGTARVLTTGAQFYKNQRGAIRAFASFQSRYAGKVEVITAGAPTPEWSRAVRECGLEGSARCTGVLSHAQMPDLYNSVDCLLFPSFYEGFGWPPLEAMACGTPVVASNAASLPEVVGDAGLMCGPEDCDGLARALQGVLTNEDLRRSLIGRGLKRAKQFSWERAARETLEVYEQVATSVTRDR
jgi:glycosyltransferase involved in cell wall biosynthesis